MTADRRPTARRQSDTPPVVRVRRRRSLARWASEIRALGVALRAAADLDEALGIVVQAAADATASLQATVRLLGPGGRRLLVGRRTGPPVHGRGGGRFGAKEGLLGWVLEHGEVTYTNDPRRDPRFAVRSQQAWMPTAVAAAPLGGREGTIGTLSAARRDGRPYTRADAARLAIVAEVAAAHLDAARLARLAVTDDLTLLPNPRHLRTAFPAAVDRAERGGQPLSVILLDLDHFGKVNNEHGYDVGDEVLRAAADRLRAACRENDLVVRKGGEEFLVVLPGTGLPDARRVAERIRRRLGDTRVACRTGPIPVTGSLGVATRRENEAGSALLRRVDAALKMAKRWSRNRVVCWSTRVEAAWRRENAKQEPE